jgi:uncharacterized membrane protein
VSDRKASVLPNGVIVGFRVALIALAALGVLSVSLRLMYPGAAASRLEPLRQWLLGASEPTADRVAEVAQFDGHFLAHRGLTALHIVPGGLFLLLLPVQLSRTIRERFAILHRWNGRLLIILSIIAAAVGLYLGTVMPFAGIGESVVIVAVGAWFFVALGRAYTAIRRSDVAAHRKWVLRAIAVPVGVSVVRLVGAVSDLTLTPAGYSARAVFVVALWIGWAATLAATEWWIRRTGARPAV